MGLHNYMEDVVKDAVDSLLPEVKNICTCEKCRLDIMALSLNKLSPKYVVTQKGRVYTKLNELALQSRADVIKEVTKAIKVVRNRPQH